MDLSPNGSLRHNGYLAVTASSVRESAFASLRVRFRLTWTRYAPLSAPQYQKSNFAFKVASGLRSTCSRSPRLQQSQGHPDLFTQGFILHPSSSVACTPSRSLRPTTPPISTAPCLMALLPIGDLCGPIYSASLRPLSLSGQFRPPYPRVDVPALRHCTSGHSRMMT
jgi:hypothetical protein